MPFLSDDQGALAGRLVLLVDDNVGFSEALSDWLESCGARVATADTVEGAVSRVRVARPDLALIDVCLPDGNGWDCVDRIRTATAGGKSVRVVAMTGHAREVVSAEAARHGVRWVLTKPVEPDALAATLAACLDAA